MAAGRQAFPKRDESRATLGEIKMTAALALLRLEPHMRVDERLVPVVRSTDPGDVCRLEATTCTAA